MPCLSKTWKRNCFENVLQFLVAKIFLHVTSPTVLELGTNKKISCPSPPSLPSCGISVVAQVKNTNNLLLLLLPYLTV